MKRNERREKKKKRREHRQYIAELCISDCTVLNFEQIPAYRETKARILILQNYYIMYI